ncbi:MAG: hypothetical protein LBF37_02320 [Rickettsiales bacterium]|jgi:hypothetical protein|nr:hypothetical protein [Rickettsiales bacterium]
MKPFFLVGVLVAVAGCAGTKGPDPILSGDFKCGDYKATVSYGEDSDVIVSKGKDVINMKVRTLGHGYDKSGEKKKYMSIRNYQSSDRKASFKNSVTFKGENPRGPAESRNAILTIDGKEMDCTFIEPLATNK